jgi:hypothetical protein
MLMCTTKPNKTIVPLPPAPDILTRNPTKSEAHKLTDVSNSKRRSPSWSTTTTPLLTTTVTASEPTTCTLLTHYLHTTSTLPITISANQTKVNVRHTYNGHTVTDIIPHFV